MSMVGSLQGKCVNLLCTMPLVPHVIVTLKNFYIKTYAIEYQNIIKLWSDNGKYKHLQEEKLRMDDVTPICIREQQSTRKRKKNMKKQPLGSDP